MLQNHCFGVRFLTKGLDSNCLLLSRPWVPKKALNLAPFWSLNGPMVPFFVYRGPLLGLIVPESSGLQAQAINYLRSHITMSQSHWTRALWVSLALCWSVLSDPFWAYSCPPDWWCYASHQSWFQNTPFLGQASSWLFFGVTSVSCENEKAVTTGHGSGSQIDFPFRHISRCLCYLSVV